MAIDRNRYRQYQFVGGRIFQAREGNGLQEMAQHVSLADDATPTSYGLGGVYRQGATYNVTVSTTGTVVSLSATDPSSPMLVFVRDRWEIIKTAEINLGSPLDLGVGTVAYLNWNLTIRTLSDDSQLVDVVTDEPAANAGELILDINAIDTSSAALAFTQLAKNTAPIQLFTFINSGGALTLVPLDNVLPEALASMATSGLVKTSTNTSTVVSIDDPTTTDARRPIDGSVHDVSVRTPSSVGGTNADGSPVYDLTGDIGGINAAKIVWLDATQRVSDFLTWIKTQFNSLLARYNAHEGVHLGLVNTHPFPTAAEVGATPLAHMGLPLGITAPVPSHPPIVNQDAGGFEVNQSVTGAASDPAYGVFTNGTPVVSLDHDGDVSSIVSAAQVVSPAGTPPPGGFTAGALSKLGIISKVLAQHVNQVSHCNPHGLTAPDIGAATIPYVDASVAACLAAALAADRNDGGGSFKVRKVLTVPMTITHTPNTGSPLRDDLTLFFEWMIISLGSSVEIGIGVGQLPHGSNIPFPTPTTDPGGVYGPGWSVNQCIGESALGYAGNPREFSDSYGDWPQLPDTSGGTIHPDVTRGQVIGEADILRNLWSCPFVFAWRYPGTGAPPAGPIVQTGVAGGNLPATVWYVGGTWNGGSYTDGPISNNGAIVWPAGWDYETRGGRQWRTHPSGPLGWLVFTNFSNIGIPHGATPLGVQIEFVGVPQNPTNAYVDQLALYQNDTIIGIPKSVNLPFNGNTTFTQGSSTDLWNAPITDALVNGGQLGFGIHVNFGAGVRLFFDGDVTMKMTVWWYQSS